MHFLRIALLLLGLGACVARPTVDEPDSDAGGAPADAGPPACTAVDGGVTVGRIARDAGVAGVTQRTVVLMGGGAEVDSAARLFVQSAAGGDVLVLRATGSVDSYTPYFADELSAVPAPATVTTFRLDDAAASSAPAVLCAIERAEAVWFAGGDQWDYLGGWSAELHERVRALAAHAAVGGTSAGSLALGAWAFTARYGGVTSTEALQDPAGALVDVAPSGMAQPELSGTLVDTHFSARAREGRLLAFAARALQQGAAHVLGVGIDEETALVIENGRFTASGAGSVFLYSVAGPVVSLTAGAPLSLQGITRTVLASGATGDWPPAAATGTRLQVVDGVVSVLP